ncbi:MAG: endo-alpha-N-acetylgalactosaminidase family protein [Terracidiphilus sp.]
MQDELNEMRRRDFLRLSGAGVAAASLHTLLPGSLAEAQSAETTGTRTAPTHPKILRSKQLEVTLDADDGLPYEYRWIATGAKLRGEDFGLKLTSTVCERATWRFFSVPLDVVLSHGMYLAEGAKASAAIFLCKSKDGDKECASFQIQYELCEASLTITMLDVKENEGYELLDVAMPRLVTVREDDGAAWLLHGDSGGNLVMLADATAGTLAPNSFWGHINGALPVNMVGTDRLLCVQETTAFMDTTAVAVTGTAGSRRASIGSGRVHRVNGHDCYNLNLGTGAPLNCGVAATPNLLVNDMENISSCRLDFLPVTGDPQSAWIKAGKVIRDRMPAIPNDFYHDKYMYGIRCDEPRFPQPMSTFAQCEQMIAEVADLTDRAPQIVHLWGWQFKGKDTGYPAVNVVDERIGGYDGMMQVMERGRALNATVSLSDNYDDAYKSSPAWNEDYIARRPDGQLWQSRAWTGEVSFIQGLAKYMEGPGVERVRYTCERYKLPQTTHIDVLSYYAIRNDWDPKHPASGIRNLRQGRYRVLEEFAKHGVDVTSEGLRYPMIGKISCTWYAQTSETSPFGGKPVPLLPLVYGKSAIWGLNGSARGDGVATRSRYLFWNAVMHEILGASTDRKQITDVFYLNLIPWMHLHQRELESFERNDEKVKIGLEGNCHIAIDNGAKTYRVSLGGVDVASEDAVFCPMDADRICFYSLKAGDLSAAWPAGWNPADAVAVALSIGKRDPFEFKMLNRSVTVNVAAQQPVILYRNRNMARI